MANEFKVKKGLIVEGSGGTILDIQGSVGQLFSITDSLTGDLFAVSDISGIPILNVNSSGAVDIDGTLAVDGDIQIAEKLIHSGDTNTYIQFPGTNDKIVLATNGSDALTLDAANLATFAGGITTGGDVTVNNGNAFTTINIDSEKQTGNLGGIDWNYKYSNNDFVAARILADSNGNWKVFSGGGDGVAPATAVTVNSAQRVGIGVTDPQAKLHVDGSVRFEDLTSGILKVDADGDLSVDTTSYSTFDGAYSSLSSIPSTFAPSSHNHDDRYYTETEIDANHYGKVATDAKFTSTDGSGDEFKFTLGDEGNISGNKWYKVAQVNQGSGGLHIKGSLSNHVESFGSQKFDLLIQGREGGASEPIEITGTVDVLNNATGTSADKVGIRVIESDNTTSAYYHYYDVYIRTTRYTQAKFHLTKFGTTGFYTSKPSVTSEPAPASGGNVELDTSTLAEGNYVIDDSVAKEIYHEGHKPTYSELGNMAYSNLTGTPTLGTAAAAATTDFATSAQGTTADAALPKAGGTVTGTLILEGDTTSFFTKSSDKTLSRIISRGVGADLDKGLFSLYAFDGTSSVEEVRLDSAGASWIDGGSLGIGTTSPTYALDVAGNAGFNEYIYHNNDSNTYIRFTADRVRIFAGGTSKFDSNNTYITSQRAISSTPTDGATTTSISSDWAFDNVKTAVPTNAVFTDTVYTHPTDAGNKHIPSGGAAGEFLRYSADGTAVWATPSYTTNTNTTYSAGTGLDLTGTTFSVETDLRDGITHVGKDTSNFIQFDSTEETITFIVGGNAVAVMQSDGDLHIKGDVIAFSDIFNP